MGNRQFKADDLLSLAEAVADYRDSEDGDSIDDQSLSSLQSILAAHIPLTANSYEGLPSIYLKVAKTEANPRRKSRRVKLEEARAERRRKLHDRIALALTDSKEPGLAAGAFTALLGSTEAAGKPIDDKMVSLALKTVYPSKRTRALSQNHYPNFVSTVSYGRSFVEENLVVKRTPVEFLARHYGLSDEDHDKQIESIAKKLDSLRSRADATELRDTYRLCRTSDEDYVNVLSGMLNAVKKKTRRTDQSKWSHLLSTSVEIWKERNLKADISSFVIDYAGRKRLRNAYASNSRNGIPYIDDGSLVQDFVTEFVKVSTPAKIEEFMSNLRLKMLGSEKKQRELSKLMADEDSVELHSGELAPVGTYYFIAKSLQSPKVLWLAAKEMQRFPFPGQDQSEFSQKLLAEMSRYKVSEVDTLLKWLGESKVLANLSDFDPIYGTNEQGAQTSVWGAVLRGLRYQYENKTKAEIVKRLSQKADLTFGEKLLLSFASGKPANIYQMYGSEFDTFSAFPKEQQIKLAKFAIEVNDANVSSFGHRNVTKLPTTKESRLVKQTCSRLLDTSVETEVTKLMEAKRFKELGVPADEFEDWAGNVLESMSIADPQELVAVVSKISELSSSDSEVATRTSRQDMPYKSRLIESVIAKDISFDSIRFLLAVFDTDGMQDVSLSESLSKSIGGFFRSQFLSTKTAIGKENKNLSSSATAVKAMEQIINRFGDELGDRELTVLIPELRQVCTPITDAEAQAVDQWLHSDDEVKHSKARAAFRLAFDCSRDTLKQWERERGSDLSPPRPLETKNYLKTIVSFIGDESIPLQARSRVAVHLTHYDTLSSDGVTACCRVITKAYDAGEAFEGLQNQRIFTALLESDAAPDIKETRIAFAKSWARSLIKRKRSFRLISLISAIKMIDESGDKAQVKNLLDAVKISYGPGVATRLIELGYFAEAEKLCEAIWSGTRFFSTNDHELARYTNELKSNLPKFLKRFKGDGKRYFAELYFASLGNDETEGKIETQPESRLTALADRFASVDFKSKRDRQLSLMLLSASHVKPEVIDRPLTKEVENLSIESLFVDPNSDLKARLLGSYFSTQIQLQNFEAIQTKWKEVNQVFVANYAQNLPWEAREAFGNLIELARKSFDRLLHDKTPEQIGKILPALRDLNSPAYQHQLTPSTAQLAHLMAGQPEELAKFFQKEDAYRKKQGGSPVYRTSSMRGFINELNTQFVEIEPANPATRLNFVVNAWKFGKLQNFSFGTKAFKTGSVGPNHGKTKYGIEQFAELGTLTDEELLEAGPAMAEIYSVNGEIWAQLARRQAKAGQYAKAAESFRKSLEDATEDMKKAKMNRKVEYASALVELKRDEEAKAMIDGISSGQLFNANKPTLKTLQKKLNVE